MHFNDTCCRSVAELRSIILRPAVLSMIMRCKGLQLPRLRPGCSPRLIKNEPRRPSTSGNQRRTSHSPPNAGLSRRDAVRDYFLDASREPLFLAGGSAAAALLTTLDFDAEGVGPLRAGFSADLRSESAETGTTDVRDGATCAFGLRPKPSALAVAERCSVYPGAVRG